MRHSLGPYITMSHIPRSGSKGRTLSAATAVHCHYNVKQRKCLQTPHILFRTGVCHSSRWHPTMQKSSNGSWSLSKSLGVSTGSGPAPLPLGTAVWQIALVLGENSTCLNLHVTGVNIQGPFF